MNTSVGLRLPDATSYLRAVGWRPLRDAGPNAAVWGRQAGSEDVEVLVPARDGLGDLDLRLGELVRIVAASEGRTAGDVVEDMTARLTDTPTFLTWRTRGDDGAPPLALGVSAVNGVRAALVAAARSVDEGPRRVFKGRPSRAVKDVLTTVRLGLDTTAGLRLTVRIPVGGSPRDPEAEVPLARRMLVRLQDAAAALADVVRTPSAGAVSEAVATGVSSQLCEALGEVAGPEESATLEITFRWAHGLPSPGLPRTVILPEGSGPRLRAAADLLRAPVAGYVSVVGVIDGLHDEPDGTDRRRVRVRGRVVETPSPGAVVSDAQPLHRRAVWVRLPDTDTYDIAVQAHRLGRRVRATGERGSDGQRFTLVTGPKGFEVLDGAGGLDAPPDRDAPPRR